MPHLFARSSRFGLASLSLGLIASSASFAACGNAIDFTTGGTGGTTQSTTAATTGGSGGATTASSGTTTDATTGGTAGGGAGGMAGMGGIGGAMTTTAATTGGMAGSGGTGGGPVDPWAGPVESLKLLDLGSVGFNAQTNVPIPDKTLGFTVQLEGAQPSNIVGVYRLRPPVGGSVVFNFAMVGHMNQVFGGQQFIAAADPQSDSADAYPVKEGAWKVTPGSDGKSGSDCHLRVWARRTNDGLFHGGVVDVNLIVVPGAATQDYLNKVLAAFFPYAGLQKGAVDTYSLPASYATIESQDEYHALLASSAGIANAPAVNLFVVDDFADAAWGGAIGVAGGIPASPMRHGTTQSGLAYQPSGDPGYDATVLMHEIGHMGGLFHTTEFAITETDPLSDTPECPHATISNSPDQCSDKSNVMFPIAYGATAFSAAQLNVLHGSALYRGILEDGGAPSGPLKLVAGGAPPAQFVDDLLASGTRIMPAAPDALERALGSLWCGGGFERSALGTARDASVKLARDTSSAIGKTASARLRAIALDDTSPILLRKRALRLYLQAARDEGSEAQAIETLLAIAGRGAPASIAERRFQAAALRLLREARVSLAAAARVTSSAPPAARTSSAALLKRIDSALAAAMSSDDVLLAAVASGN